MPCEYCLGTNGWHEKRCPNYWSPNDLYCDICGNQIDEDEEYICNGEITLCEKCANIEQDIDEVLK